MTGKATELPTELGRRDGSGERLAAPIAAIAGPVTLGAPDAADQAGDATAPEAEEPPQE